MCSPSVCGSKSVASGLGALSLSGTSSKRATQPCPCGFRGTRTSDCRCDDATVARYVAKLSGPLLDRIDLHVEVTRVPFDEIISRSAGESSAAIRGRVERARSLQRERYVGRTRQTNASIGARDARRHCALDPDSISLLRDAAAHGNLSARALDRLARVARTIADLEGASAIEVRHIAEALGYRTLERKGLAA